MKRYLSVFLSFIIFVTTISFSFNAYATKDFTCYPLPFAVSGESYDVDMEEGITGEQYIAYFVPDKTEYYELVASKSPQGCEIEMYFLNSDYSKVEWNIFDNENEKPKIAARLCKGNKYYFKIVSSGDARYKAKIKFQNHTHVLSKTYVPAEVNEPLGIYTDGYDLEVCKYGEYSGKSIKCYAPKKMKATNCVYNGSNQLPKVKVYDTKGNLISASNYTVKANKCKNVGTYAVNVVFNGKRYKGSLLESFSIKPAPTTISSVSSGSGSFTVKWKKQAKQVDKYQIQFSLNSNFSNATTKTVSDKNTTSKTLKKLKKNKKYYVRVRTCKKSGYTNYYSSWSAAKSIKTKK